MTEADLDALAWNVVRTVRDQFIGLRRTPSDADWHEAIVAALLSVHHSGPDLDAECAVAEEQGYFEGYDDCDNGRPHRWREKDEAA